MYLIKINFKKVLKIPQKNKLCKTSFATILKFHNLDLAIFLHSAFYVVPQLYRKLTKDKKIPVIKS